MDIDIHTGRSSGGMEEEYIGEEETGAVTSGDGGGALYQNEK